MANVDPAFGQEILDGADGSRGGGNPTPNDINLTLSEEPLLLFSDRENPWPKALAHVNPRTSDLHLSPPLCQVSPYESVGKTLSIAVSPWHISCPERAPSSIVYASP